MRSTQQPRYAGGLDLLRNEEGTAIVEFLIVAPILLILLLTIQLFTDLNRFSTSAQVQSGTQSWRSAAWANEASSLPRSDEVDVSSIIGDYDIRTRLTNPAYISLAWHYNIASSPRASIIYGAPPLGNIADIGQLTSNPLVTPFEKLGMKPNNFDNRAFDQSALGIGSGPPVYNNQFFLDPVNAMASTIVGSPAEQDNTPLVSVPVASRSPLMYDSYSINPRGTESEEEARHRVRNVDRYTIQADPLWFLGLTMQAGLTGNYHAITDQPDLLQDAGLIPDSVSNSGLFGSLSDALEEIDNFDVSDIPIIGGVLEDWTTNSTALWKVDKESNKPEHDEDGEMQYDNPLTSQSRLGAPLSESESWEMIQ